MASLRYAKARARIKSRQVYRSSMRKPKRSVAKLFSNFVGKVTFKSARNGKPKRRATKRMTYKRPKRRMTRRRMRY